MHVGPERPEDVGVPPPIDAGPRTKALSELRWPDLHAIAAAHGYRLRSDDAPRPPNEARTHAFEKGGPGAAEEPTVVLTTWDLRPSPTSRVHAEKTWLLIVSTSEGTKDAAPRLDALLTALLASGSAPPAATDLERSMTVALPGFSETRATLECVPSIPPPGMAVPRCSPTLLPPLTVSKEAGWTRSSASFAAGTESFSFELIDLGPAARGEHGSALVADAKRAVVLRREPEDRENARVVGELARALTAVERSDTSPDRARKNKRLSLLTLAELDGIAARLGATLEGRDPTRHAGLSAYGHYRVEKSGASMMLSAYDPRTDCPRGAHRLWPDRTFTVCYSDGAREGRAEAATVLEAVVAAAGEPPAFAPAQAWLVANRKEQVGHCEERSPAGTWGCSFHYARGELFVSLSEAAPSAAKLRPGYRVLADDGAYFMISAPWRARPDAAAGEERFDADALADAMIENHLGSP